MMVSAPGQNASLSRRARDGQVTPSISICSTESTSTGNAMCPGRRFKEKSARTAPGCASDAAIP